MDWFLHTNGEGKVGLAVKPSLTRFGQSRRSTLGLFLLFLAEVFQEIFQGGAFLDHVL